MVAINTSDSVLRGVYADLDGLFEAARKYMDNPSISTPVWLYFQSDGEGIKRSLVLNGKASIKSKGSVNALLWKYRARVHDCGNRAFTILGKRYRSHGLRTMVSRRMEAR